MKNIDEKVKEYENEIIEGIRRLVKIPSIEGIDEENMPFGKYPKLALEEALKLSEELGFKTRNIDGAIGYAEYGEGNEYIGILGHVDIVPEGNGWSYNPFDVTVDNGKIYGRGVLDNKGPIISCLYGMKIIKDLKLPISKKIRVIFGTNEESGFKDIPYYLKNEKTPIMGFTPDCKYPAIYGERGILDITISQRIDNFENNEITIKNINGDFRSNVVPDYVDMVLKMKENQNLNLEIKQDTILIEKDKDTVRIIAKGVQAPGNAPELGKNAITLLCKFLSHNKVLNVCGGKFIEFVGNKLHKDHNLKNINMDFYDEVSGHLISNPYKLKVDNGRISISMVIRYPVTFTFIKVLEEIQRNIPENMDIEINRRMDSVCFDLNHPMLKVMKGVYEKETGLNGNPVTTTGGTYAKVMPNIVAFGPSFPGQKGIAHNKDEYMDISDLLCNVRIYTKTIYELANLEV